MCTVFYLPGSKNGRKNLNLEKSKVVFVQPLKMGLLCQKRSFKSELEPKWNIFQKWRVKVLSHFSIHFRGKQGKNARRGQLWRVVSRQPLWIEAKVSPFWKLDIQGYNIHQNERKFFQNSKTPSVPLWSPPFIQKKIPTPILIGPEILSTPVVGGAHYEFTPFSRSVSLS